MYNFNRRGALCTRVTRLSLLNNLYNFNRRGALCTRVTRLSLLNNLYNFNRRGTLCTRVTRLSLLNNLYNFNRRGAMCTRVTRLSLLNNLYNFNRRGAMCTRFSRLSILNIFYKPNRLGAMSGFNSLGKDLLDLLPVLVWLNRWVYEGVTSAGSTFDVSTSAVSKIHPLMRVHVPLPLTINCMWLLKNIYFPWITREQVWKPKMKPQDVVSESNVLHRDDNTDPSGLNKVADNSPSTLIRVTQLPQNVLRDDDIVEVSPARNILASSLHLSHLAEDNVRGATGLQAVDHDVQGAAELQAADHGVRGEAELQAADHDVRGAAKFQAAADHDEVPAILVQSPTSDEATFPHPGASGRGGKQRKGGQMNMTDNGRTEMGLYYNKFGINLQLE